MSLYTEVRTWNLPQNLLKDSINEMAPDGRQGNEGIVFWLGQLHGTAINITHMATLPEIWLTKRPDFMKIASEGINRLTDCAAASGAFLVGQIHSHPGSFVDLSMADRRHGFSVPNFLSVVAPHYAQVPSTNLSQCGVHVYERKIGFRRFNSNEVNSRLIVQGDRQAILLKIGSN